MLGRASEQRRCPLGTRMYAEEGESDADRFANAREPSRRHVKDLWERPRACHSDEGSDRIVRIDGSDG
jgi:hypothetical protein